MVFCWLSDSKKLVWRPQMLVHKSAHNVVILMMFWSAEASILTASSSEIFLLQATQHRENNDDLGCLRPKESPNSLYKLAEWAIWRNSEMKLPKHLKTYSKMIDCAICTAVQCLFGSFEFRIHTKSQNHGAVLPPIVRRWAENAIRGHKALVFPLKAFLHSTLIFHDFFGSQKQP